MSKRPSGQAKLLRELGLGEEDLAAWEVSARPSNEFEDWLTDRVARRPEGARALEVYGADDVHDFARSTVLEALQLGPADRLLEIGCGGGLLLRDAMRTGARATGLDHSEQMVRLARERAPGADVRLGRAEDLPYAPASFTAVAMSVVFFLFPDPMAVLTECRRVLQPPGRLACYTTGPELKGTPAAPEPLASQGYFYEDERLLALAREAGLQDVVVADDGGGQLLTARA